MAANHRPGVLTYVLVFAALMALTACTVLVWYLPLPGWMHTPAALLIAVTKATLIVLFFMHGLESGKLVWLTLAGSVLMLAILIAFTLADYNTRNLDESIRRAVPEDKVRRPYP
jgi:cytochrome c oxidase subunit 4